MYLSTITYKKSEKIKTQYFCILWVMLDKQDKKQIEKCDSYWFLRLSFGITFASQVYCKTTCMIYEHLEGADTSMDDILVWRSAKAEHERLKNALEATKADFKLNKDEW